MSESSMIRQPSALPDVPMDAPQLIYEYLAFSIDEEAYGVPLHSVREILKVPPLTEVPRSPQDVLGIISVRGQVITVIDLRQLIHAPERAPDKDTRVLLVDSGREVMGLLVDRVHQVFRLSVSEVEIAAEVGGDLPEHVFGIGRPRPHAREAQDVTDAGESILILLDPSPLLRR